MCGITCLTVWVTLMFGSRAVFGSEMEEASEGEWLEDTATVLQRFDMTPRQTKDSAFKVVLRKMQGHHGEEFLAHQISLVLQMDSVRSRSHAFTTFSRPLARVENPRIVDSMPIIVGGTGSTSGERGRLRQGWWVKVRGKVVKDTTERDPGFNITADLNRQTFRVGEKMEFKVWVSQDCYLTVFAFYQDGSMALIYPYKPGTSDKLTGGLDEPITIPPADCGWGMHARLKPGVTKACEAVIMVATKKLIPFRPIPSPEKHLGFDIVKESGIQEFSRWLGPIPINQSAQIMRTYEIHEK